MSSEWPLIKLSELIKIKHGFAFKGEFFCDEPTELQLTTPGNFAIGGGFQAGKGKYYSGPYEEEYVLKHGDLIVTMTDLSKAADTLGFGAIVPNTPNTVWLHNQRVGLVQIKPNAPIVLEFLHYLLRSSEYRHWVVSTATGSTVKHTSPGRICDFEFRLPPKFVQVEIGKILTSLDDRIALLRETNATLEAIAQALFKSWFVDFDPVHANAGTQAPNLPAEIQALFPSRLVESPQGLIPEGWEVGTMQDLFVLQRGFDLPASERKEGAYPLIAASGPNGTHNISMVKGPGVVTGRSGVLGKVFFTIEDFWPLNTTLWIKEFKRATPCYALEVLKRLDTLSFNAGSAVPSLNRNHIHGLPYLLPPVELIGCFEATAMALHRKMHENNKQAETLANLRDTLLPRLISGQLRLPEAEAALAETA
ncbi:restriction endonuclease subunit S [Alkalimonas sp.]|uniref:restriction endonuclease subunit S n=1 Tax=Alkalimonas sp. TaxID=1872453 RepID=UPI00263B8EF7|nr:restriction endonuclease subunit S [Alkalimonas sp.]MCC5825463.1 restriction endonuclease subunit S [Alkalimonas sp.]